MGHSRATSSQQSYLEEKKNSIVLPNLLASGKSNLFRSRMTLESLSIFVSTMSMSSWEAPAGSPPQIISRSSPRMITMLGPNYSEMETRTWSESGVAVYTKTMHSMMLAMSWESWFGKISASLAATILRTDQHLRTKVSMAFVLLWKRKPGRICNDSGATLR